MTALSLDTPAPRPSTAPTTAAPRPGDALWALRLALLLTAEAALRGAPDTTPTPPAEVRPLRLVPEPRGQT